MKGEMNSLGTSFDNKLDTSFSSLDSKISVLNNNMGTQFKQIDERFKTVEDFVFEKITECDKSLTAG